MSSKNRNTHEKILAKIAVSDQGYESPCWLWTGALTGNKYSRIVINYKSLYGHRYFYTYYKGPVPEGLVIDHLCKIRHCCNPDHLEAVSQKENVARGLLRETNLQRHAERTHCKHGHVFDRRTTKQRYCSICARVNMDRFLNKTKKQSDESENKHG